MKNLMKWLGVFAAIGTVIGLIVAFFLKKESRNAEEDESLDFTEDEDFDLDADLRPSGEREYVSLRKDPEAASEHGTSGEETEEEKE